MNNSETNAARSYHDGSKHPDGFLMNPQHYFDPRNQPILFKLFHNVEAIPLELDPNPRGIPALTAITSVLELDDEMIPSLGTLGRILFYSAGITKTINYQFGEVSFRAAACTGGYTT